MGQRAPRRFLVLLTIGLGLSASFAGWMEGWHLRWLQSHPISVNLISGVVGFCGGFLTLAIAYNWFVDAETIRQIAGARIHYWGQICHAPLMLADPRSIRQLTKRELENRVIELDEAIDHLVDQLPNLLMNRVSDEARSELHSKAVYIQGEFERARNAHARVSALFGVHLLLGGLSTDVCGEITRYARLQVRKSGMVNYYDVEADLARAKPYEASLENL